MIGLDKNKQWTIDRAHVELAGDVSERRRNVRVDFFMDSTRIELKRDAALLARVNERFELGPAAHAPILGRSHDQLSVLKA